MKVCRLVWDFPQEGELTHGLGPNFYYISREQAKLGLDVNVIASRRAGNPYHEKLDGVDVHRVGFPFNVNAMRRLRAINREGRVDVVHAHGTCGLAYPLVRKRMKIPLVVHVHGTTLQIKRASQRKDGTPRKQVSVGSSLSQLREEYFWKRANLLVAVSKAVREELRNLYGIEDNRIVVVYNGIDTGSFQRVPDTAELRRTIGVENRRVILFVGHFGPRKNLSLLLDAMSMVLREVPDAFLLCVGGTPKWLGTTAYWTILTEKIRSLSLENAVKLVGEIPHRELQAFYSMADVFVLPSHYEGLGKVILEANACGVPVVASRTSGVPEIVKDGLNGFLVEPGDVADLAEKLTLLLKDVSLARKMGAEGRKMVLASFTWERTARDLLEAYNKLLEKTS